MADHMSSNPVKKSSTSSFSVICQKAGIVGFVVGYTIVDVSVCTSNPWSEVLFLSKISGHFFPDFLLFLTFPLPFLYHLFF